MSLDPVPATAPNAMSRLAGGLFMVAAYAVPSTLILAPLAIFLTYGFWQVRDGRIVKLFTLQNYAAFLQQPAYHRIFVASFGLALEVAVIATLLGFVLAYLAWRSAGRMRSVILVASIAPLAINYVVKMYAVRSILGFDGVLNRTLVGLHLIAEPSKVFLYNRTAVLITMTVLYLPYAVAPIFLALQRIAPSILHASADLGAQPGRTFWRVVAPLSLPGVAAAAIFVALLSLGDFLTPQMVGGIRGFTFGSVIWSQFGLAYDWPQGVALGVILLLTVLLMLGCARFAGRMAGRP